jgi:hypothetical protein
VSVDAAGEVIDLVYHIGNYFAFLDDYPELRWLLISDN